MILLTVAEIVELHSKLIERIGGTDGIRDIALLESAVYSALSSFDGLEAYPSIEERAARLMFSLVGNHAFLDRNKRICVLVMLLTLNINGVKVQHTQKELIDLGLSAANGKISYQEILLWINNHKI